jgi:hypothetical protein
MAYRIENIDPLNLDYQVAIGVSIPFVGSTISGSDAVFPSTYTSTEQIRSNLINFMLTNKGERYLNPNYGSNLRRYVFQNMIEGDIPNPNVYPTTNNTNGISTAYADMNISTLQTALQQEIQNNFPQLNIQSLVITPNYDINSINIVLTYSFMNGPNNQIILNI